MCGILGIVGKNAKLYNKKIESMLSTLSKRGPDEQGLFEFAQGYLGQTRLSILDLTTGKQPMKDHKENIIITFNGEIYNYKKLKNKLKKEGCTFQTKSDTEVILKLYIKYGENCTEYLEGMFAFAIWDGRDKKIFAARDRFGEKPFYYAFDESNNFIFASEIKAILASEKIKPKMDMNSVDAYLSLMYIPPFKTIYKNIHVLPPASILTFKNEKIKIKKYWSLKKNPINISFFEAKKEIKKILNDSVKKMMVADVEIGSFLSGGIDSTLITAYAQKHSSFPIKTFSVGYENHINELPFALEASRKINTDHNTLEIKGENVKNLKKICSYLDEPHADSSNFPQYMLSRLASSKIKVALTGDGADELFMGYGSYWRHKNLSWKKHFFDKLTGKPFKSFQKNIQIFSKSEKKKLWKKTIKQNDYIPDEIKKTKLNEIEKINLYDLSFYLPGQLLTKVDRTGMMNSLETRCPFLDKKLAEFVYNLPLEFKTDGKQGKILLKNILEEIMPKKFVHRRKQGFGAPIDKWLLEEAFKDLILSKFKKNAEIYNFFRKKTVLKLIKSFYLKKNKKTSYKIWTLLCLELWLNSHKTFYD